MPQKFPETIQALHSEACKDKKNFYIDPATNKKVLTSYYLKKRGFCCCSGCRHCPWE